MSATRGEDCFAISTYPVHQRQHLRGRLRALFGQLEAMLSELFTNWTIYTNKVGASPTNSAAVAAPAVLRSENPSSFSGIWLTLLKLYALEFVILCTTSGLLHDFVSSTVKGCFMTYPSHMTTFYIYMYLSLLSTYKAYISTSKSTGSL